MEELPVMVQIAVVFIVLVMFVATYLVTYTGSSALLWQHRLELDACIMKSRGLSPERRVLSPELNKSTITLRMPDASGQLVVCNE